MNPSFFLRNGIFAIVVLSLIGAGYFYSVHRRNVREAEALGISCEASGGVATSTSLNGCVCPPLFPLFDETLKSCHDRMGGKVRSKEEYRIMARRFDFANECRGKGNEVFVLDGTPLTFCYPYVWGNSIVAQEKKNDQMVYRLTFVSSTPKGTREAPTFWFVQGEQLPIVPDFRPSCISCLTTSSDAVTLSTQLGLTGKGRLVGGEYASTTMFAAYNDTKNVVMFVAPNIWKNYHLFTRAPYANRETVEIMLNSVWFDEHIY
jgi:hypothetical protein